MQKPLATFRTKDMNYEVVITMADILDFLAIIPKIIEILIFIIFQQICCAEHDTKAY